MADQSTGLSSPQLHPTYLVMPKETHVAEVDHDLFTGNKVINTYEVLSEIGRGEHGKVKLGQDLLTSTRVAVKIVPRFSNKRRLGKLGAPEDRVKKEVAILKKARHPNVVSLLEVIDDPSKKKVYIVLEHVDHGEIRWRRKAPREISTINNRRLDFERHGREETDETLAQDAAILHQAQTHRQQHQHDQHNSDRAGNLSQEHISYWSLDHTRVEDSEASCHSLVRNTSVPNKAAANAGVSLGDSPRVFQEVGDPNALLLNPAAGSESVAAASIMSHHSSRGWGDDEEEESYVPMLTLAEAKSAFRDTLLGLEFLHFQGIIHRDIKPANLLVTHEGRVKISDFGVSYLGKPLRDDEHDTLNDKLSENELQEMDDPRLLAKTVGTPAFYAPELIYWDTDIFEDGKAPVITGAVDLWALGVTLYCMIYGRLPFSSEGEWGLFEKIMKEDVFLPKQRLKAVNFGQDSRAGSRVRVARDSNDDERGEHELIYEDVPDTVRDLIKLLLIKDPAHRITIERAKVHPWVVEGIEDPVRWVDDTDPRRHGEERIVVSGEDVSHAVVKKTVLERAIDGVKGIAGIMIKARKRAASAAPSTSNSVEPMTSGSGPSASTVGRDRDGRTFRQASMRGEDIAVALRATREGEMPHPLARSEIASPDGSRDCSYFDRVPSDQDVKSLSTGCSPLPHLDRPPRRPRGPDRLLSALSTADSTKTVRAPQPRVGQSKLLEMSNEEPQSPNLLEMTATNIGHIFSGAGKRLSGMRSRERRPLDSSRSSSADGRSPESRGHAEPSLAISNAIASGKVSTPEALRAAISPLEDASPPPLSLLGSQPRRVSLFQPPPSSNRAFESAQATNRRRQQLDADIDAQREDSRMQKRQPELDCPPSPDDEAYDEPSSQFSNHPSASTIASSAAAEMGDMSQSTSQPSIPSVDSGASSLFPDEFVWPRKESRDAREAESSLMSTSETVTTAGRPATAPPATAQSDVAKSRHKSIDIDDGSSDEEGLSFGKPRQ